jgi:tetratricopeptide (TPR) repeat protein
MRVVVGTSRGAKIEYTVSKATVYSNIVREFVNSDNVSYELLLKSYLVIAMKHELENDFEQLLDTCNKALKVFRERSIKREPAYYLFDARRIMCYIQLGSYKKAEELTGTYINKITPGSVNWFDLHIQLIASQLHSGRYNNAYATLEKIRKHKQFLKQPGAILQTWTLYEAYVEFLLSIGKISSEENSKFRIYKFLNEIPIYAKDKRGFNIAILIVHVLFLLARKKYSKIIDRVDALNQYCHRHLRRDDTFRSNCFIKMLLQMAKADFNKKRTIRYAQPLIKKLNLVPFKVSNRSSEIEIIQYEILWDIALELLD